MTKKEAIKVLKEEQRSGDTELAHGRADNVLCELLTSLGHADVVAEFEEINKWYA